MSDSRFLEEERSRQPSVFSIVREIIACMSTEADPDLGLYGAFGFCAKSPMQIERPKYCVCGVTVACVHG